MNKKIIIKETILNKNDLLSIQNNTTLNEHGIFGLNIMASPGAGKTSLIEMTLKHFIQKYSIGVIDGDLASHIDADRAEAAGAFAVQVNTGGECHLDAFMINNALKDFHLRKIDLLIVENVGNLVCPISFQLGTHKNILIASTPEGDDKPYKYPPMYMGVDVILLNKIDLLPYLDFDVDYFINGVIALNPGLTIFKVSCKTGDGLKEWIGWLDHEIISFKKTRP